MRLGYPYGSIKGVQHQGNGWSCVSLGISDKDYIAFNMFIYLPYKLHK